jgi:hypothetical protein
MGPFADIPALTHDDSAPAPMSGVSDAHKALEARATSGLAILTI